MEEFATLEKLFARLGARLNQFETKAYLVYPDFPGSWQDRPDFTTLIYRIDNHIYGFNPKEAYNIVVFYEKRVKDVLNNLEPVKKWVVDDGPYKAEEPIPVKYQKELMDDYTKELNTYLSHFQTYKRILSEQVSKLDDEQPQMSKAQISNHTPIELPENFTVTQLNKHFEPQLSVNQAALFLYYLREQAILPSYSDSSIGKLAEAFFVRNQKNITKSLTDIHTVKRNKDDLKALKLVLDKLLKEIDTDLKEAR